MSDKKPEHWRDEKNKAIEENNKKDTNDYEKAKEGKDAQGNHLPGFPGHFRYRKEQEIEHLRGTTGINTFGKAADVAPVKKPQPKKEEPKYDHDEIKAMNKARQVEIINGFDPDAKIPKYESDRIKLILKLQKDD